MAKKDARVSVRVTNLFHDHYLIPLVNDLKDTHDAITNISDGARRILEAGYVAHKTDTEPEGVPLAADWATKTDATDVACPNCDMTDPFVLRLVDDDDPHSTVQRVQRTVKCENCTEEAPMYLFFTDYQDEMQMSPDERRDRRTPDEQSDIDTTKHACDGCGDTHIREEMHKDDDELLCPECYYEG